MERIAATVRDEAKAAREETCWWSQGHNGAVVAIGPRNIRTWAVLAQRMLAVEDTTLRVPFSSLLSRHATVSSTGVSRAWCIVPAMNGIESHLLKESESNVSFSFFFIIYCRFRTCLKMAGTASANFIGKIFFDVLRTKCFILKPQKVCTKWSWTGKCQHYEYRKQAHVRDNVPYH